MVVIIFCDHILKINTSLTSGHFSNSLKEARVNPLLKKPTLNPSNVINGEACGTVVSVLVFGSGEHRFKPHCSQHVAVSLGKTLHPKVLLWGLPTVLSMKVALDKSV